MSEGMENVIPLAPKRGDGGEVEGGGKMLEFKRKLAEDLPEPGMEMREKIDVQVSTEELHAILVGLTKERRDLKIQLDEIKADPDLETVLGAMVEGMLAKNTELMSRLAAKDPTLEKHFKGQLE